MICPVCDGTGRKDCGICEGDGSYYRAMSSGGMVREGNYTFSRWVEGGEGRLSYVYLHGSQKEIMIEGPFTCSTCHGNGKLECRRCNGSGDID